ncbi:MAG TPA: threonine synthase [Dehalococcoidia bacterium]|nr:threonine synthase [Dehalococcoidia bacterium]HLB28567.1 threonine synthase [Dehalococcoidia bacterium]
MSYARSLRCRECGRQYPLEPIYVCEFCFGPLEATYDYEAIGRAVSRQSIDAGAPTMWRYADLLPCDREMAVDISAGFTPLIPAHNLGQALGLRHLYLKNDCVNPTWSFKDRVVAVAATKALEFGFDTLACASTGNLANSVAAHAARAGMAAVVFIPADLEREKVLGSAVYGPTIVAVDGSYDDVNRLCSELADKYPWAFVNINVRPYYAEGSKTLGYEVAEQLGWRAPDHCLVPVASGSMFTKIYKGLREMSLLGLIPEARTQMYVAQAEGCSPIATAWLQGSPHIRPVKPATIAKSLAIGNPADGYYALKTITESGGGAVAVTDEEVVDGMQILARAEGIFAETAGGVVTASLRRLAAEGRFGPDDTVVAFITGAGLKTQEAVASRLAAPLHITPTISAFEEALAHGPVLSGNEGWPVAPPRSPASGYARIGKE